MFRYVMQRGETDCVIACLAMITEKSYEQVMDEFNRHWMIGAEAEGVDDDAAHQYLAKYGYAIRPIYYDYMPSETLIKDWPIKPFAPIHLLSVYADSYHASIMDADGKIYDPYFPDIKSINEYHRVYAITGIYKVGENNVISHT